MKYEHERVFTFVPEEEVTDRYTFENALYAYAMEKNKLEYAEEDLIQAEP